MEKIWSHWGWQPLDLVYEGEREEIVLQQNFGLSDLSRLKLIRDYFTVVHFQEISEEKKKGFEDKLESITFYWVMPFLPPQIDKSNI